MRVIKIFTIVVLYCSLGMAQETIYQGKCELVRRAYIMDLNADEILVEVGGTSMKVGGDYIKLTKEQVGEQWRYTSPTSNSYIIRKKNKLWFYYAQDEVEFKFKLKPVPYSEKINANRYNIFRSYDYTKHNQRRDIKLLEREFEQFKKNPINYITIHN